MWLIKLLMFFVFFFFFKQKTAYERRISDWSSDVCSSDLGDKPRIVKHFCHAAVLKGRITSEKIILRFVPVPEGIVDGGHVVWCDIQIICARNLRRDRQHE